ncbi:MAG: RNA 2',3'-cyclic phosphodiesterase [Candidatus Hydrogenedens sp.]|nr:RNA 2',3'-cyclic phosphodiesterase [Candidatus Hydrogenedens sp.]
MRCFAAIGLPQAVKARLAEVYEELRASGVRGAWVLPEQMHITLRFLGEIPEELAAAYAERMTARLAQEPAFDLRVCGAGCFPNPRNPSVLWAGLEGETARLRALAAIAEEAAVVAGCSPEPRKFQGHVTLGRIHAGFEPDLFLHVLEGLRTFDAGAFRVKRVTLYESRLRRSGPVYAKLEEFPLQDD